MTKPSYKVGMLVEHPNRPEWGPGKIVAVSEDRIFVYFRDALEKKARAILTTLVTPNIAENQSDAVMDLLPAAVHDGADWMLPKGYEKRMRLAVR